MSANNPLTQPLPKGTPHNAASRDARQIADDIKDKAQTPTPITLEIEVQPQMYMRKPQDRGMVEGMERTTEGSRSNWVGIAALAIILTGLGVFLVDLIL